MLSISKLKAVDFNYFHFHFYFLFNLFSFILFLELGLGLVTTSLDHTSVTSDNIVTVTVTSHMKEHKNILKEMMSYSI